MTYIMKFRNPLRAVILVGMAAVFPLQTLAGYSASAQDARCQNNKDAISRIEKSPNGSARDSQISFHCGRLKELRCPDIPPACTPSKVAPEGLTRGTRLDTATNDLEGTWSWFAVHTGKAGGWKHTGTFTITNDKGHLKVRFHRDNPKADNQVTLSGSTIILERDLTPHIDSNDKMSSQTWMGTLYEHDKLGKMKIEGKINGAGMKWELENKNSVTFLAVKN